MRASSPIVRPSPSAGEARTRHCGGATPASRSWAWNCCDTRLRHQMARAREEVGEVAFDAALGPRDAGLFQILFVLME
jgi:hypothetical protein